MGIFTAAQIEAANALHEQECERAVMGLRKRAEARAAATPDRPPEGWTIPPYDTLEFWRAVADGWITEEQAEGIAQARQERVERARAAVGKVGPVPARWSRPEPQGSRQYVNHMATTAARDQRLTPQAKALLQIVRARCGHGLTTETTKGTLAAILGRHVRTIQRYIQELVAFGYLTATPRRNKIGAHTGLVLQICEKVLPFWKDFQSLAAWLQERAKAEEKAQVLDFIGETFLSPINDPQRKTNYLLGTSSAFTPRWMSRKTLEPT